MTMASSPIPQPALCIRKKTQIDRKQESAIIRNNEYLSRRENTFMLYLFFNYIAGSVLDFYIVLSNIFSQDTDA